MTRGRALQVRAGVVVHDWEEVVESEDAHDDTICRLDARISYTGDLDASSELRGVITYASSEIGTLVGLERVRGTLRGEQGSLLFAVVARIDGERLAGRWSVIEGSGTAEWAGLEGSGEWVYDDGLTFALQLWSSGDLT